MTNEKSEKNINKSNVNSKLSIQKRQVKLLKSALENLINKQSVEIIDLLSGKKNVNEFTIAKNLKLTINQIRNILYKLSDYGLVSFIRKKDKRKGWYIYFWTLNVFQSFNLLDESIKKKLDILEKQVKNRKENSHYYCATCSIEVTEETALLNNFICPECDEVYQLSENKEVIDELEKKISKLKKELVLVQEEKEREGVKLEIAKTKKIKKLEAEKKAKRAANKKKKPIIEKKEKVKKKPIKAKKKAKKKPKKGKIKAKKK